MNTYYLNNADVMNDAGFKQLGSNVALYFANQTPPKVAQNLGTFVGSKIFKTRGESDEQWCKEDWGPWRNCATKQAAGAATLSSIFRVRGRANPLRTRLSMSVILAVRAATSR